ncbi:MAG TPA: CDP-diacylglycerol--glycerol-3-phosphate 3-phosphatidyltransferase [Actinomycetota bacterium]|nr:CDP-diacylglycerol--glycerol-3-phosphate 3-phosphatidyltransferase [Actinomycetota bacterium]
MSEAADRRAAIFLEGITYLRAILVPVIMWLVLIGDDTEHAYAIAGWLFAFAAITDFFDGYLARRWRRVTILGSFLDTTADKLLVSGVLVALVAVGRASPWIAFIIVGRELLILGLRGVVAAGGEVMKPSIWGKLKANVQFIAITLAIWRLGDPIGDLYLDQWAMLAAAFVTIGSGVEYLMRFAGSIPRSARAAKK